MQETRENVVIFMEISGNLYEVICSIDTSKINEPLDEFILGRDIVRVSHPYMFGKGAEGELVMTPFHLHSNTSVSFRSDQIVSVSTPSKAIQEKYDERVSIVKLLTKNPEYISQVLSKLGKEPVGDTPEEQAQNINKTVH